MELEQRSSWLGAFPSSALLAVEPQAGHLTSLSLGYLTCKMGIIPT